MIYLQLWIPVGTMLVEARVQAQQLADRVGVGVLFEGNGRVEQIRPVYAEWPIGDDEA